MGDPRYDAVAAERDILHASLLAEEARVAQLQQQVDEWERLALAHVDFGGGNGGRADLMRAVEDRLVAASDAPALTPRRSEATLLQEQLRQTRLELARVQSEREVEHAAARRTMEHVEDEQTTLRSSLSRSRRDSASMEQSAMDLVRDLAAARDRIDELEAERDLWRERYGRERERADRALADAMSAASSVLSQQPMPTIVAIPQMQAPTTGVAPRLCKAMRKVCRAVDVSVHRPWVDVYVQAIPEGPWPWALLAHAGFVGGNAPGEMDAAVARWAEEPASPLETSGRLWGKRRLLWALAAACDRPLAGYEAAEATAVDAVERGALRLLKQEGVAALKKVEELGRCAGEHGLPDAAVGEFRRWCRRRLAGELFNRVMLRPRVVCDDLRGWSQGNEALLRTKVPETLLLREVLVVLADPRAPCYRLNDEQRAWLRPDSPSQMPGGGSVRMTQAQRAALLVDCEAIERGHRLGPASIPHLKRGDVEAMLRDFVLGGKEKAAVLRVAKQ